MRIRIARCEAGLRIWYSASSSGISPPRCGRARWRSSSSSSGRPRLNGSITSTPSSIGRRTRKCPGNDTPSSGTPRRRATSICTIASDIGIAEPAVEHFVEIAVARVVILVVVALVAELLEQVPVDRLHLQRPRVDRLDLAAQVLGVALQQRVVEVGIELRVFVARDQQRGRQQRQGVAVERGERVPVGKGETGAHGSSLRWPAKACKSRSRDVQRASGMPGPKRNSAPSLSCSRAASPALSSST